MKLNKKNKLQQTSIKSKINNNKKNSDQIGYKNKMKGIFCIFLKRRERKKGGEEKKNHWNHIGSSLPPHASLMDRPWWVASSIVSVGSI
jgi:hypothetical protein